MTLLRGAAVAAAALAVCLMMAGSSDAGRTSRSLLQTATVGKMPSSSPHLLSMDSPSNP